jgi:hypothetical protein
VPSLELAGHVGPYPSQGEVCPAERCPAAWRGRDLGNRSVAPGLAAPAAMPRAGSWSSPPSDGRAVLV